MQTILVGSGAIAYCHARALKEVGVKVFAVYDVREEAAAKLADFCGAKVLKSMEEFSEAVHEVDMVHLCTPPAFRLSYLEIAAKAGCHIITEKPMAISVEDAEKMAAIAKENHVQLMVDYNHRFRPGFRKLQEIVQSGQLGEITSIFVNRMGMLGGYAGTSNDTWRRKPGSVCGMSIESLSHDIDMIIQLGGPIRDVKADIRGTFQDVPEFDNNVHASMNLESGAMANLYATWSSWLNGSSRGVVGTEGTAILEGDSLFDFNRLRLKTSKMEYEEVIELQDIYNFDTSPSYTNITRHFLESLEANKTSTVSGEYALSTLRVSHAILDAAATQQTVKL
ncbi:MAG: Gfo/Idh/MocA family oxidoreductase [Lachnospiraceae bacterium]|nr:Gfo/Idh/MocA family oxidoreductase [Lachnospiraceae bacterium]